MRMHQALEIAALDDLPLSIRRMALAAANGSVPDLKNLRSIARSTKTSFLPVVYILLDPARIPTPEAFDAILEHNASDHAITTAIMAWDLLLGIQMSWDAVLDLWPRLWAWFEFLDTYSDILSSLLVYLSDADFSLIWVLLTSAQALILLGPAGLDLLKKTSGFYTVVGRAWSSQIRNASGCRLNTVLEIATASEFHPEMLEQLSEGAGSFGALALLVTRHLQILRDARTHDGHSPICWAVRILDVCVGPIELVAEDTRVARTFLSELVCNGVIECILHTVIALCKSSDFVAINWCFTLLRRILCRRPIMGSIVDEALDGALQLLIRSIIQCTPIPETHSHLAFFLRHLLPSLTVHHHTLLSLQIALKNHVASTSPFPESAEWQDLLDLVRWRSSAVRLSNLSSTCDNIKCNQMSKDLFKRTDWKEGGHRESCSLDRRLSLISGCGLPFSERLHIRALLKADYLMDQPPILCQIARCLRAFPDAGYFVLFDYTSTQVTTAVYSLAAKDWGTHAAALGDGVPEWKDYTARAAGGDGRYTIHVLRYLGVGGVKYWVIPLRSTKPTIDVGLRRIVADSAIGNDDFVDALKSFAAKRTVGGVAEQDSRFNLLSRSATFRSSARAGVAEVDFSRGDLPHYFLASLSSVNANWAIVPHGVAPGLGHTQDLPHYALVSLISANANSAVVLHSIGTLHHDVGHLQDLPHHVLDSLSSANANWAVVPRGLMDLKRHDVGHPQDLPHYFLDSLSSANANSTVVLRRMDLKWHNVGHPQDIPQPFLVSSSSVNANSVVVPRDSMVLKWYDAGNA
ncbi:hypothetical protein B0H16DRAFT_1741776 [Mycena metata]|uniref:Uncharacterized protein n=1 Tax=Mycena metata TaxID=1033252 RepID=A0AAD7HA54_9AGAR|nr:hypothetical protein B0H16DRAFT_1741776 [Mycena metata]